MFHRPLFLSLVLAFALTGAAQITNVDNTTSTPVEGVGHDYIHFLSETVVPSSGMVSLRIQLPTLKGRGMILPFSIDYDSGSVNHLVSGYYPYGNALWSPNVGTMIQGGWSYGVPGTTLTQNDATELLPTGSGSTTDPLLTTTCTIFSNYEFRDPSGGLHALGLSDVQSQSGLLGDCSDPIQTTGGDSQYQATIPWAGPSSGSAPPPAPFIVTSRDGTVFHFSAVGGGKGALDAGGPTQDVVPPDYIEDRNGNRITSTWSGSESSFQFSFTDTLGRTLVSSNGFGPAGTTNTLMMGGLTYQVTWKTTSVNYTPPSAYVGPSNGSPGSFLDQCMAAIPANQNNPTVISIITLPNGQAYTFYYGNDVTPHGAPTNPFGLLSEIDYPTGAFVTYTWALSSTMNELADWPGGNQQIVQGTTVVPPPTYWVAVPEGCLYEYETPVVTTRQSSFGGSSPVLTQNFSYTTTWAAPVNGEITSWTQKTTTVTTQDNITGNVTSVKYSYAPLGVKFGVSNSPALSPVEQSVSYSGSGGLLRTETKGWIDPYTLYCQVETLNDGNGQSAGTWYLHLGTFEVTNKKEYDYGLIQPASCQGADTTDQSQQAGLPSATPTRETVISYAFATTALGGTIANQPSSVQTWAGLANSTNGTLMSETDPVYDKASVATVSGLPSGTHDETNYAATSTTPRGNATQITHKCFIPSNGQTCTDSVSSFTFDETGQILTATDALGHVTSYFYTDSFTDTAPSANTNAFMTKITYPATANGSVSHVEQFSYAYSDGSLTKSIDQNGQTTTYAYDDPWRRPTEIDYPPQVVNGTAMASSKTFVYTDSPASLSVQENQQQDGSNTITDFKYFDGTGHVTGTKLLDPEGNVLTATTYDGLGRVLSVTNPYRSTEDTTYGVTSTQYDALGRVTSLTHPDGSTTTTTYAGRAVKVQDEGNGTNRVTRISQSDGLDRLTSVCELTGATQTNGDAPLTTCGQDIAGQGFLTTYTYDTLNNLTGVQQGRVTRSFGYDSLSRLLSAANPESGITTYNYDANGNPISRTRPAPNQANPAVTVTTNYKYDELNRPTATTYTDTVTNTISRHYDTSLELGRGLDNTIGRLSAEYVTSPSGQLLSGRVFSYDPMARVIDNSQCLPQNCGSSTAYALTYGYDLVGHELSASNGQGVTFNYSYDSAGRLTNMTSSLSDANHPGTVFSGATYNPLGSLTGASVGNILNEALAYDCRARLVSYGSALLPTTATAPAVTNSGCPVAVAMGTSPSPPAELLVPFSPSRLLANLLQPAQPNAWSGLRFQPAVNVTPGAPKALTENLKGSPSGSILLTRLGKPVRGEHGSVTILLSFPQSSRAPQAVSATYRAKDNPAKLAKRLRKRINSQHDSLIRAEVSHSGPVTAVELVSRERGGSGFLVQVTVDSDQAVPSLRATTSSSSVKQRPPDLLTAAHPGQEVRQ
jgi:YD repeat-containing protein